MKIEFNKDKNTEGNPNWNEAGSYKKVNGKKKKTLSGKPKQGMDHTGSRRLGWVDEVKELESNEKLKNTWTEYAGSLGHHKTSKSINIWCRRRRIIPGQRHRKYF